MSTDRNPLNGRREAYVDIDFVVAEARKGRTASQIARMLGVAVQRVQAHMPKARA